MEYEDIYAQDLEENEIVEEKETKDYRIILSLTKFSDKSVHRFCSQLHSTDEEILKRSGIKLNTGYMYPIDIYSNGISEADTDYIAIVFRDYDVYCMSIDFATTIAVIDIEEWQRFIRSFSFSFNINEEKEISYPFKWPNIVIDRYLSRKTLLDLSEELLPNDTLTLCIELHITEYHLRRCCNYGNEVFSCIDLEKFEDGRFCLNLNSPVGEKLAEESNVFRQMVENTKNDDTELLLPYEEYFTLLNIGYILLYNPDIIPNNLDEIIDMYICSDKYDVPIIIECCRKELKSIISENNISRIRELADRFNDDELLEHIQTFQETNGNTSQKYVRPPSPVESNSEIPNFDFYT